MNWGAVACAVVLIGCGGNGSTPDVGIDAMLDGDTSADALRGLDAANLDATGDATLDSLTGGDAGSLVDGCVADSPAGPPVVSIYHPRAGESFSASQTIPFIGMGTDYTCTALTDPELVWQDFFNGTPTAMGSGSLVGYALGQPGTHVIALTGTDRFGSTATVSVMITAN